MATPPRVRTLVQTSTPSVVFDGCDIRGGDESLPYSNSPLCHYAATKIVAEKMILAANSEELRTAAIRPHLVWGPGDTQIIPRLLQRGRSGSLRVVGAGDNLVDITYIDNVAHAHILAARNLEGEGTAAGEPFFISQGSPVRLWNWINNLFERLGVEPVKKHISFTAAYRIGSLMEKVYTLFRLEQEPKMTRFLAEQLAMSHWFSIEKAREILSYEPLVSDREGLENLIEWLSE